MQATEPVITMHQRCPQRPEGPCQSMPSTCPTCGAGRFCVGCGAPVWTKLGNWMWVPNSGSVGMAPNVAPKQAQGNSMMVAMQGQFPQASMMMGQQQQHNLAPTLMVPQRDQAQQKSKGDVDNGYLAGPQF